MGTPLESFSLARKDPADRSKVGAVGAGISVAVGKEVLVGRTVFVD